jgi:hypothetical protein
MNQNSYFKMLSGNWTMIRVFKTAENYRNVPLFIVSHMYISFTNLKNIYTSVASLLFQSKVSNLILLGYFM